MTLTVAGLVPGLPRGAAHSVGGDGMRGMKVLNEYAEAIPFYSDTPKAVFAAIALSLARRLNEDDYAQAIREIHMEWNALYRAGVVPQEPLERMTLTREG